MYIFSNMLILLFNRAYRKIGVLMNQLPFSIIYSRSTYNADLYNDEPELRGTKIAVRYILRSAIPELGKRGRRYV